MVADEVWYHGSPFLFELLEKGSTITRWRELAEAFSHKPDILCVEDSGEILHKGKRLTDLVRRFLVQEGNHFGERTAFRGFRFFLRVAHRDHSDRAALIWKIQRFFAGGFVKGPHPAGGKAICLGADENILNSGRCVLKTVKIFAPFSVLRF